MNAVGVDLSSRAIDIVLLDENTNRALWQRYELHGETAFERARDVREQMPPPAWFVNHSVYMVAIERPFAANNNDVIRLVEGAVLSWIPRGMHVREVAPHTWKAHLGFRRSKEQPKPSLGDFPQVEMLNAPGEWPQDALDALGVALFARDENASIIEQALKVAS